MASFEITQISDTALIFILTPIRGESNLSFIGNSQGFGRGGGEGEAKGMTALLKQEHPECFYQATLSDEACHLLLL